MTTVPVITQVDLPLSDVCNLNCSFCYTKGGYGNKFSQAHIDKCFDWMFRQFNAGATEEQRKYGIRVTIYGGEPLVEWENLKNVVVTKKALAASQNIILQFSIVTNMTLLTEDKLDWLLANRVGIHASIDGCAPAQDTERRFHNGQGTSEIVYANARRLLAKAPGRSCRMTVAPSTVQYLYDSIVFMTKEIGFQTVNAVLAGGVEWTDANLEVHKAQIEKVTDWWIDEMRQGRHWSLYHLRNMFMGIWSGRRMRGLCSSGVSHIGIDTAGNFYPCHRFCNLQSVPEYLLGTLDTGFTNLGLRDLLMKYDLAEANKERCKDCPAVLGCHAFCLHEMMLAGNGMFEPLAHYCKIWPFYWKMATRAHSVLMAENNQLYVKTYGPKQPASQQRPVPQQRQNVVKPAPVKAACSGQKEGCSGACQEAGKATGQAVSRVVISTIRISQTNADVDLGIQYQLLDKDGKLIRSGIKNCSREDLVESLAMQGKDILPLLTGLVSLLPVEGKPMLLVSLLRDPITILGFWGQQNSLTRKVYTGADLEVARVNLDEIRKIVPFLAPIIL